MFHCNGGGTYFDWTVGSVTSIFTHKRETANAGWVSENFLIISPYEPANLNSNGIPWPFQQSQRLSFIPGHLYHRRLLPQIILHLDQILGHFGLADMDYTDGSDVQIFQAIPLNKVCFSVQWLWYQPDPVSSNQNTCKGSSIIMVHAVWCSSGSPSFDTFMALSCLVTPLNGVQLHSNEKSCEFGLWCHMGVMSWTVRICEDGENLRWLLVNPLLILCNTNAVRDTLSSVTCICLLVFVGITKSHFGPSVLPWMSHHVLVHASRWIEYKDSPSASPGCCCSKSDAPSTQVHCSNWREVPS